MKDVLAYPFFLYSLARSLVFSFEYKVLESLYRDKKKITPPTPAQMQMLMREVLELLKQDAKNIVDGVYPAEVLEPESLLGHLKRLPSIVVDSIRAKWAKKKNKTKEFKEDNPYLEDKLPEYFKRNFHFQNEGYLSEKSAELYDHQVEILFSGTANAMRRGLITTLKKQMNFKSTSPLKILELASGRGSATKFLRLAFPQAHITVTDLSRPYLKQARYHLAGDDNMDFLTADASDLPFKDGEFDIVCSTFLFHEIPLNTREEVLKECLRLTRDTGVVAHLDSLQYDDKKEFNLFLDNFPREYHEPFYKNYCKNPVEELMKKNGYLRTHTDFYLLSKCVLGFKTDF
jgi:ubiquinone/menaquinone biosynthesis C-methylase UbiE